MLERLPYFRFHSADYLLDTAKLRHTEDHGAYLLLILHYYWDGSIPTEKADLYELCHAQTDRNKAAVDRVLARYFHDENGRIVHHRIERELQKLGAFFGSQRANAKASVEARKSDPPARKPKGNGADHAADDGFDAFRAAYPRHEAMAAAEKAWAKLAPSPDLQLCILDAIGRQRASGCLQDKRAPDGRSVIPLPASWINGKRWTDAAASPSGSPADAPLLCAKCGDPDAGGYTQTRDGMLCTSCWQAR